LRDAGYVPKERNELIECLKDSTSGKISLTKLSDFLKKLHRPTHTDARATQEKYKNMPPLIKVKI
jgi:hypothetical protein